MLRFFGKITRVPNKSGNYTTTDKEIALSLAEKKWKEVYGKSSINKQKPFATEKKNDSIWIVH